jgi:DNA-binding MarR family transcriptional regulator
VTSASELADRLHSAAIHLLRTVRREDDATGLTAPRLSVLSVLVFGGGGRTVTQLAEAEQVRPPTMTRLVQGLEADGLIRRERDAADARVVRIHATARGRRLLQEGRARRIAVLAASLAELPESDRRKLERATDVLEGMFGRRHSPRLTRSK